MAGEIANPKFITFNVVLFPIIKCCIKIGVMRGWGATRITTLCPSLKLNRPYARVPCFYQAVHLHTLLLHRRKYTRISSE